MWVGLNPGLRRSPGEGHSNPLHFSCLENPMNRGVWWATVPSVPESEMSEATACTHNFFSRKEKGKKILSYECIIPSVSSVTHLCPTLCYPLNCSTPGLPVHYQLPEFTQTHVHWVSDAIQTSHPLPSPSPPALNLSQHQGLFQWVSSLHQVAKLLKFQLHHQSFQWTPRTDLL